LEKPHVRTKSEVNGNFLETIFFDFSNPEVNFSSLSYNSDRINVVSKNTVSGTYSFCMIAVLASCDCTQSKFTDDWFNIGYVSIDSLIVDG
jgi:hypothetical protein